MRSFYIERRTWLHAVPAGWKLAAISLAGTLLYASEAPALTIGVTVAVGAITLSLGRSARPLASAMSRLAVVLALILLFHALVDSWWIGLNAALRVGALAALGFLLALTTPFDALLAVLETALRPLRYFGLRPERLALSIGLMLRFIEVFFLQWRRLDDAYRARSGRSGGFRLLAPLAVQALASAERVGEALSARLGR